MFGREGREESGWVEQELMSLQSSTALPMSRRGKEGEGKELNVREDEGGEDGTTFRLC